jgi:hypothetical protein
MSTSIQFKIASYLHSSNSRLASDIGDHLSRSIMQWIDPIGTDGTVGVVQKGFPSTMFNANRKLNQICVIIQLFRQSGHSGLHDG